MTTSAESSYGSKFLVGDGATPETFTELAEVISIVPPEIIQEAVEATNHSSGGYKEFISNGLKELGEFSVTVNFLPGHAVASGIANKVITGAVGNYQIEFPNDITWTFGALVTNFKVSEMDAQNPEVLTADLTFRPTGEPTLE